MIKVTKEGNIPGADAVHEGKCEYCGAQFSFHTLDAQLMANPPSNGLALVLNCPSCRSTVVAPVKIEQDQADGKIRNYTTEEVIATCDQILDSGLNLPILQSGIHTFAMLKSLAIIIETDRHLRKIDAT